MTKYYRSKPRHKQINGFFTLSLQTDYTHDRNMKFEITKTAEKSEARAGTITTDHGIIETPIFMPVGT